MSQSRANQVIPEGYYETEVGVLPNDWQCVPLGQFSPFVTSGSRGWASYYSEHGAPFVRITNMFRDSIYLDMENTRFVLLPPESSEGKRTSLQNGDILISITADIGICSYVDDCLPKPAYINQHIALVRIDNSRVNSKFVSYFLSSENVQKLFLGSADQGAKAGMNLNAIRKICTALPHINEQTAIANALSDIDALLTALEKILTKKQTIKKATMQQLLTGKKRLSEFVLHTDGEKKGQPKGMKRSELGEIPEDWDAIKMGELANIQRGASPRPIDSPIWFDRNSEVGWLRISDVTRTSKYLTETTQGLSKLGIENSRYVSSGNLVMSICATVGKPILTRKHLCIHDGFVVFKNLQVEQNFMYYALKDLENEWGKQGQTGSQMNLNTDLINRTYVAIPRLEEEQTTIATILSDMDEEIQKLKQRLSKTRQIKQGMMQELLTGRTRLPFKKD
ncbi:restriction endonuclease subunit S [Vibrio alginolyticus]|uniref:restriction endonuclease subunit S n=1 Tax=Vibrio alginolyticus TaxID=663 RepID=UPI00215C90FB|nr:restriction endonuclease subunit S [Vibrio alginolyticus]MCR9454039.1 restriction endonuclease subunit S [Vibrio alginolyticus]MCR9463927.1 restriction endonuclease subunit S [Vibrio alginolyticus]